MPDTRVSAPKPDIYRVAFAWVSYADSAGTVLGGQSFLLHKLTQETHSKGILKWVTLLEDDFYSVIPSGTGHLQYAVHLYVRVCTGPDY